MYGLLHVLVTLYFWRASPVGIIALAVLCVGDGLAEVVGRGGWTIGALPWNKKKVTMFGTLHSRVLLLLH